MPSSDSKFPTALLLSLGTIPLLAVLVGSKAVAAVIQDIGQASEEIFRGDRLPVLKMTAADPAKTPD